MKMCKGDEETKYEAVNDKGVVSSDLLCDKFKTSDKLEKIVGKFKLRIFEIVPRMHGKILRFDFSAINDSGQLMVAGSCGQIFKENESPRELANNLRMMANILDKYWARAFPTALDT